MASITPTRGKLVSASAADKIETRSPRTSKLRRRIVILVVISVLLYPVLIGLGKTLSLVTLIPEDVRNAISRALYSASMYATTFGLTAAVALWFVYSGVRRWNTSFNRSKSKAIMFGVHGIVAVLFSFSAFAILLALVGSLWVR